MRFSIDANILVYSFQTNSEKASIADRLMFAALGSDCLLTNQAVGEFFNVVRKRLPDRLAEARAAVESWSVVFPVAATTTGDLVEASLLAQRHKLQFWDSVILVVAGGAGAECLLSEDMQDGTIVNGVRLINPFKPENTDILVALLTPLL